MKSGKRTANYPIGSVSCATMREEDLIPDFAWELKQLAKRCKYVAYKTRMAHLLLVKEIETRMESEGYYESDEASYDPNECLFDALDRYAAPYFYFGAHPGDSSDYGFWLSEEWDDEFSVPTFVNGGNVWDFDVEKIKVSDLSEIPVWFRGEVAVVSDHGNVTLYVKTSRSLREVWAIV